MIPCHVCGQDIGGGWSIGFPPAPDSQKMGLCRKHDRADMREQVQKAWQELIYQELEENNRNSAYRAGDIPQLLSIYFTGGGSISIPCSSFSLLGGVAEGKTLRIITPGGESIYFPLGQVRNYALSPLLNAETPPRRALAEHKPLTPPRPDVAAPQKQNQKKDTPPGAKPKKP